jgi:hypothetical protein
VKVLRGSMQSHQAQVGDFIIWSLSDGYLDVVDILLSLKEEDSYGVQLKAN